MAIEVLGPWRIDLTTDPRRGGSKRALTGQIIQRILGIKHDFYNCFKFGAVFMSLICVDYAEIYVSASVKGYNWSAPSIFLG